MKSKIFGLVSLSIFIIALFAVFVSATTLSEWPLTTNGIATNLDSNVNAGIFTSSGVTSNSFGANGANAEDWSLTTLIDTAKYFEVTISPKTGYNLTISDVNFNYSTSITGPASFELQYSTQSSFGSPTSMIIKTDANKTDKTFSNSGLNIQVGEGKNLTFRWFGYNFSANTNEFRIENLTIRGTAVVIPSSADSFCSSGAIKYNNLTLNVDINNKGQGDDEDWMPLDTIEVKVKLNNNKNLNGDGDLNKVMFELGLFKKGSSNNIISDMMWISKDEEKVRVGDIDEGDDSKYTFKFRVDPREVKDANYVLRVKAFPKGDENDVCIDYSDDLTDFGSSKYFADVRVSKESDKEKMVVVDKESYPLITTAFCGEEVILPVDIFNIGDEDFDNQVKVTLFNKILGINEDEIASGDLNEGEKTDVAFSFKVPKDAEEKTYTLIMETFYDYNKDDETYDENSDNTFGALLKVKGNCLSVSTASVSASLESGGKAGEDLIVKAIVKNTGDKMSNYLVNAAGYTSWASSAKVEPTIFTLNPGESKDVLITLRAKDDASGEGLFNLEVLSGNELVQTQKVSVSIEETPKGFFTGGIIGNSNLYFWGLGLLNVILILSIVFVVVRLMRK